MAKMKKPTYQPSLPFPPATVDSLAFARQGTLAKRTEAAILRQTAWAAFESALFTDSEAVQP